MKITIPRSEIKEAVAGLGRIVTPRATLPVLSCVRLDVNGAVTVTATDLEQSARYQFGTATNTGTGSLVIPYQALKELAKGNDREQIEIETDTPESGTVINHMGSLAVKKTVYGTPLDEWPVVPDPPATKPAEGFLETYRKLLPFTSEDPTRHMLGGICVDVTGKGNKPVTMVATDGRRLTCCNSMVLPLELTTVIPANKFLGWTGLPADTQEIGIKTETVKVKEGRKTVEHVEVKEFGLKAGAWTYACRTIDGSYPNWRQVIPDPELCKDNRITLTDEDVDALRKILPTFPGHDQSTPSITLGAGPEGAVQIAGRGKDDKAESTLALAGGSRFEGKSRICLNREFLLDALNVGFRTFAFTDSSSPIRGDDGKGGTHCLMPMRLEEPVQPVPEQTNGAGTTAAEGESPATPEPADHTDNQGDGAQPEPETTEPKRRKTMANDEKTGPKDNDTAFERMIAAYEAVKAQAKATNDAVSELASALREALREDKQRRAEVENVRAGLAKLQSIKV